MFKTQRSIAAFVLLTISMLLSSYSYAAKTYKCDDLYPPSGWWPKTFSVTYDSGDVTQMTSDMYRYDLDKVNVRKASNQLIWVTYKSSQKTSTGATINVRHAIKVYPKKGKFHYELVFPNGYRQKAKGYCR